MKLPRKVYVILPLNADGIFAGIYVGSSCNPEKRLENHLNDFCIQQKELHDLMRDFGFEAYVLDTIDTFSERHVEFDWIDLFSHIVPDLKIFNVVVTKNASLKNVKNGGSFMYVAERLVKRGYHQARAEGWHTG